MGLLSVTVGLTVAMLGNAILAVACAGALVLAGLVCAAAMTTEGGTNSDPRGNYFDTQRLAIV